MSWVKLDDQFTDHPKIAQAGALAGWLYVCGLTYSARYLTDGFVPAAQVRRLADVDNAETLAARLVAAGLWEPAPGGYQIHDYLDYQPSGEAVRKERAASNARVAEWRTKKREERNGQSNGVTYPLNTPPMVLDEGVCNAECNADVTPAPSPSPSPSVDLDQPIESTTPPLPAAGPPERVDNFTPFFEAFWQRYPARDGKKRDKLKTRELLRKVPARDWDDLLTATGHYAASSEAARNYARDPCRFLQKEYWRDWMTPDSPTKETSRDRQPDRATRAERTESAWAAHLRPPGDAESLDLSGRGSPSGRAAHAGYPRALPARVG